MIIRDEKSRIIPLGRVTRSVEESFLGTTTLPPWLSFSGTGTGATHSFVNPDTTVGGVRLSTGQAKDDSAYLNIFPSGIGFSQFKEIIIDIDSPAYGSANSEFRFEMMNAAKTKGVIIKDAGLIPNATSSVTQVEVYHSTNPKTTVDAPYQMFANQEYNRRRSIRIRIQHDGTVAVGEYSGDIEHYFFVKTFPSTQLELADILFPKIGHINRGSTNNPSAMRIPRIAARLVHNL